ncbi:MAG TPA: DUF4870 domain-containing protein [Rhodanobacteraceae bacterium]|jgi:uncharacterized Tic20 family protein|nr:DUF4870 domain-containing protein [Rhodanobacteraceae bacterium]
MSVPPESAVPNPPVAGGSAEDRNLAMLTHLSGIIFGFIVPLIVWLVNKENAAKSYLTTEAKEALNFQLTILIGYVICWFLTMTIFLAIIGGPLWLILWIVNLVFCIVAAMAVNSKGSYRYPFALRLIK